MAGVSSLSELGKSRWHEIWVEENKHQKAFRLLRLCMNVTTFDQKTASSTLPQSCFADLELTDNQEQHVEPKQVFAWHSSCSTTRFLLARFHRYLTEGHQSIPRASHIPSWSFPPFIRCVDSYQNTWTISRVSCCEAPRQLQLAL